MAHVYLPHCPQQWERIIDVQEVRSYEFRRVIEAGRPQAHISPRLWVVICDLDGSNTPELVAPGARVPTRSTRGNNGHSAAVCSHGAGMRLESTGIEWDPIGFRGASLVIAAGIGRAHLSHGCIVS
eukprot:scaffold318598_cov36-Tisochrysis_lutea.AAC.1